MTNHPAIQHEATLVQGQITKQANHPTGNFSHSEFQWGLVAAIHPAPGDPSNTPASVDLYLDGAQNRGPSPPNSQYLTLGVKWGASGYFPTVGDTVLVQRGRAKNRTSHVVLFKLYGAASPYYVPLANGVLVGGQLRYEITTTFYGGSSIPMSLWGGPNIPEPGLGIDGDWYLQQSGVMFTKEGGAWVTASLPPSGVAGGDLSGSYPDPTVVKINDSPLGDLSAPATNDSLTWDGAEWVPGSNQPVLNRRAPLVVPDGYCAISVEYFAASVTLEGDAVLVIL